MQIKTSHTGVNTILLCMRNIKATVKWAFLKGKTFYINLWNVYLFVMIKSTVMMIKPTINSDFYNFHSRKNLPLNLKEIKSCHQKLLVTFKNNYKETASNVWNFEIESIIVKCNDLLFTILKWFFTVYPTGKAL